MQSVFSISTTPTTQHPTFGRQVKPNELTVMTKAVNDKVSAAHAKEVREPLCMAFSKDAEDLEHFQQAGILEKSKFALEMTSDMKRIGEEIKQMGLPKEDTPILFLIKSRTGKTLDLKDFNFQVVINQVIKFMSMLPPFLISGADELKKMDTSKLAKSATKPTVQEVRDAAQKVIDKKIPVQEMVMLMKLLFDQAEPKDLIQANKNFYVLRLYIPGEPKPTTP